MNLGSGIDRLSHTVEAEETTRFLSTVTALREDLNLILNTHVRIHSFMCVLFQEELNTSELYKHQYMSKAAHRPYTYA